MYTPKQNNPYIVKTMALKNQPTSPTSIMQGLGGLNHSADTLNSMQTANNTAMQNRSMANPRPDNPMSTQLKPPPRAGGTPAGGFSSGPQQSQQAGGQYSVGSGGWTSSKPPPMMGAVGGSSSVDSTGGSSTGGSPAVPTTVGIAGGHSGTGQFNKAQGFTPPQASNGGIAIQNPDGSFSMSNGSFSMGGIGTTAGPSAATSTTPAVGHSSSALVGNPTPNQPTGNSNGNSGSSTTTTSHASGDKVLDANGNPAQPDSGAGAYNFGNATGANGYDNPNGMTNAQLAQSAGLSPDAYYQLQLQYPGSHLVQGPNGWRLVDNTITQVQLAHGQGIPINSNSTDVKNAEDLGNNPLVNGSGTGSGSTGGTGTGSDGNGAPGSSYTDMLNAVPQLDQGALNKANAATQVMSAHQQASAIRAAMETGAYSGQGADAAAGNTGNIASQFGTNLANTVAQTNLSAQKENLTAQMARYQAILQMAMADKNIDAQKQAAALLAQAQANLIRIQGVANSRLSAQQAEQNSVITPHDIFSKL